MLSSLMDTFFLFTSRSDALLSNLPRFKRFLTLFKHPISKTGQSDQVAVFLHLLAHLAFPLHCRDDLHSLSCNRMFCYSRIVSTFPLRIFLLTSCSSCRIDQPPCKAISCPSVSPPFPESRLATNVIMRSQHLSLSFRLVTI